MTVEDKEEVMSEDAGKSLPTPVRLGMDTAEGESEVQGGVLRRFVDPRNRQEWIAKVSGRSVSGVLPIRTVSLIDVSFSTAEDSNSPQRRAIWQGESLEGLDEEGLLQLFRSSRPYLRDSTPSSDDGHRRNKRKSGMSRRS